ncbi:MAG TPA: UDP-glucose/GDP-mannose dehydrogenase family protein [Gemmatimonadaceae bacterium]|nr:UDP-glucose/GDP-mannose dehydrogenase family protein [Gemmatimonadaceae bacterium]
MRIAVVGSGYVGLVVGACLAESGNDVCCVDVDAGKIDALNSGVVPIYEPGLDALVRRNLENGRLRFTTALDDAVRDAAVAFIAVGTPPNEDGSADLDHVLAVGDAIGRAMTGELVIVIKSTVPVGTSKRVSAAVAKHARHPFHMCSNPEFLKEGNAIDDFMRPDRVVIGVHSDFARVVMAELYAPFVRTGKPVLMMDVASAEIAKYASNAMLATRITFMNEIANLCERVGADVDQVRQAVGADRRIGPAFLFPGPGYGGSCFPKDVKALVATGAGEGVPMCVLAAVDASNERQKRVLFAKVLAALDGDLAGRRVAVWGLAFKPQTDDVRESPAMSLIFDLLDAGATVVAHDPVAMHTARVCFNGHVESGRVTFARTNHEATIGADALVIATDWNEYRTPNLLRVRSALARPVVVDGRNLYDPRRMAAFGFRYYSIGRSTAAEDAT